MAGEPGHQELCDLEQAFVLKAIREDIDLRRHMDDAVQSLSICLAADESVRTGQPVSYKLQNRDKTVGSLQLKSIRKSFGRSMC